MHAKPGERRKQPASGHFPPATEVLPSFALPTFTTGLEMRKVNLLNKIHPLSYPGKISYNNGSPLTVNTKENLENITTWWIKQSKGSQFTPLTNYQNLNPVKHV